MLEIALDMLVLAGLFAVLQDREPEWLRILIVAVILGVVNFILARTLGAEIGIFVVVPIVLVNGLILFLTCGLTPGQTAIAVGVLLGYKIVLHLVMGWLFRMPAREETETASRPPVVTASCAALFPCLRRGLA